VIVENGDILNSWKEIAAYLGRGVRTVQRWEAELYLPVRRPRDRTRSAVIAFRTDLDQWVSHAPMQERAESLPADPEMAEKILESRLQHLRAEIKRVEEDLIQLQLRRQQNEPPDTRQILKQHWAIETTQS